MIHQRESLFEYDPDPISLRDLAEGDEPSTFLPMLPPAVIAQSYDHLAPSAEQVEASELARLAAQRNERKERTDSSAKAA